MKIAILGNDHTNTLGLVQAVGIEGHEPYAFMWGLNTGIVKSSKYIKTTFSSHDADGCVQLISQVFQEDDGPIIILCSCDGAAIAVEKYKSYLSPKFLSEYSNGQYSISQLQEKNLQVRLASQVGFNVPSSFEVTNDVQVRFEFPFKGPYIFKALKSVEGDKSDLTICQTSSELRENLKKILYKTPRILVQQYIERDYEISILGCALSNGSCILPAIENKLSLFPKNVGLECLAKVEPLTDKEIIKCISQLIKKISYVGLFSVEMMHCKTDGKFYFTEINLRNDGANSFIRKYGFNLACAHINDLLCAPVPCIPPITELKPGYYLWEIHHFYSLLHRDISLKKWLQDLYQSRGGLVYETTDFWPFIRQFTYPILSKLKLIKKDCY